MIVSSPRLSDLLFSFMQDKMKPGYLKKLPETLKLFSEYLGDKKWFAGDKVDYT